MRELPITEGWKVQDNNLLACSEKHTLAVFDMLRRQKQQPEFTGGLEPARFQPWIAEALREAKPRTIFLSYDNPDDFEPLQRASRMLLKVGFRKLQRPLSCYVLIGGPRDSIEDAERRLRRVGELGLMPFAMLYRDSGPGRPSLAWRRFQRYWCRPAATRNLLRGGHI